MAEIRLKENESLDSALRRFKSSVPERASSKRSVRERLTKSPLSSVRRSQKQLASASTNKLLTFSFESGQFLPAFLCLKTV